MLVDLIKALKNALQAQNMQMTVLTLPFEGLEQFDYGLRRMLNPDFDFAEFGRQLLEKTPRNALILTEDFVGFRYALFRLPDGADVAYLVGPWVDGGMRADVQEAIAAEFGEQRCKHVLEFHQNVRRLDETTHITALHALVHTAYADEPFCIREQPNFLPMSMIADKWKEHRWPEVSSASAAFAEERYRLEDALLSYVMQGDLENAMRTAHQLSRYAVFSWTAKPIDNVKIQLLSGNARLCKAVTHSAVHPLYADEIYNRYVSRIDEVASEEDRRKLVFDMLKDYCDSVNRFALKDYSPLVQRVINYVNLNLDAMLSLKSLAALCCISPSYLSNLFRAETGITLTDFITRQRIRRAAFLLVNENNSVAQVGVQVGFLDDNYFTRTFKKVMGMPPTAYRRQHQQR